MRYQTFDVLGRFFVPALCFFAGLTGSARAEALYVDSKAIRERFETVTAEDMEMLRGKKIILVSRSFGMNTFKGLSALAKQDKKYDLVSSYERFNVFQAGGNVGIIPGDILEKKNFVHILGTYYPHTKRLEELDTLLKSSPHEFGGKVDAVIVFYHYAAPALFDTYAKQMEAWRAAYPKVRFIYVASGFMGPKYAKNNEESFAFGEKIRAAFKGKVPLYDMGAILSDDFRAGHVYCPEYSRDPAEVHPNDPAGEAMLAKGFLLVLKEAFAQPPVPVTGGTAEAVATAKAETLPATHPDAKAVRAILDANGLTKKAVAGVSVVKGGRIVELFLQEGSIAELPDAIGDLTALRKLHVYGDRTLNLPLLKKVSPAIGKCTEIEELLLNQNDLTTLPSEIASLQKLRNLSVAENHLAGLPPEVTAWARKFDPKGLADQTAAP
jgi:Leucine-rich repeat (LRR) protein